MYDSRWVISFFMKELNLLRAYLRIESILRLKFIIAKIMQKVTIKNGIPIAKKSKLLTAPKIKAVNC
jgi:hypothetical protein